MCFHGHRDCERVTVTVEKVEIHNGEVNVWNAVGKAHQCIKCKSFIPIFCGITEEEEGYGQRAICNKCIDNDEDDVKITEAENKKREPAPQPEKKRQLSGKREERFCSIFRIDASSVNRHKKRWHSLPDSKSATFVPSTSPEVRELRARYKQILASYKSKPAAIKLDELHSPTTATDDTILQDKPQLAFEDDETRANIVGHNATWHHQKGTCVEHLCLIKGGSKLHEKAMENHKKEVKMNEKKSTAAMNIFRAAIVDVKIRAAGVHFETLLPFLALCSVNVGSIGHSRNKFNDILYCLEKTVNSRMSAWLNRPLESTQFPPHFWATVDKGTIFRTTNQATLIVARNESGTPCPIPVAAPTIYAECQLASYQYLVDMLLASIRENFTKDLLSRLCGVAADGPCQACGFQ
eukprot:gene9842-18420_t